MRLFINGVLSATTAVASALAPVSTNSLMLLGYSQANIWPSTPGTIIDEARCSKVARNTTGYTPATVPFVSDANTDVLYHLDAVESNEVVTVYDYEIVPSVSYSYSAVVNSPSNSITSTAGTSGSVSIATTQWWELDPTNYPSAINAQPLSWNPLQVEQSTANVVLGQSVMSVISSTLLHQDFNATMVMFTPAIYTGFQALLTSQSTIFISSPFGANDSGYFRIGPQSGGMSSGSGNTTKNTTLNASTVAGPYREVAITAIAAARPTV